MSRGYTSVNEHTGQVMNSKALSKQGEENYSFIFAKMCCQCGEKILHEEPTLYEEDYYHEVCLEEMFQEELDKA